MIAHVVLFSPACDRSAREFLDALVAASGDIPSIKRFRAGRRIRHGIPGYEQMMRVDYEFAAIIEFDSVDALKAYLAHPSHAEIGRHFSASASESLAYDYALVEAGDVSTLLE